MRTVPTAAALFDARLPSGAMTVPLDGVAVLELTSWMAAPSAGAILADLGADVNKSEPPRGDPMRSISLQPKLA